MPSSVITSFWSTPRPLVRIGIVVFHVFLIRLAFLRPLPFGKGGFCAKTCDERRLEVDIVHHPRRSDHRKKDNQTTSIRSKSRRTRISRRGHHCRATQNRGGKTAKEKSRSGHDFGKAESRQNPGNTRRYLVYDATRKQSTLRESRSKRSKGTRMHLKQCRQESTQESTHRKTTRSHQHHQEAAKGTSRLHSVP